MKKKIYMLVACLFCTLSFVLPVSAAVDYLMEWDTTKSTKPYWVELSFFDDKYKAPIYVRLFFDDPAIFTWTGTRYHVNYTGTYEGLYSYPNGRINEGKDKALIDFYSNQATPLYISPYRGDKDKYPYGIVSANYDVKDADGNIVFTKPPEPVDPAIPSVTLGEDWWTAILTQITPHVPAIVVVIGGMVLLILLWRYLRRSAKSSMV